MKDSLHRVFGYVIAYVLPGYVALWGIAAATPGIQQWLLFSPEEEPTTVRFLAAVLGSLGVGLVVSAVRCASIDQLHHWTGLAHPRIEFGALEQQLSAFLIVVEHNYRYYQFYANMAVSLPLAVTSYWLSIGTIELKALVAACFVEGVLLFASRDSLRRFYRRTADILAPSQASLLIVD
jgi:hypothetical protein